MLTNCRNISDCMGDSMIHSQQNQAGIPGTVRVWWCRPKTFHCIYVICGSGRDLRESEHLPIISEYHLNPNTLTTKSYKLKLRPLHVSPTTYLLFTVGNDQHAFHIGYVISTTVIFITPVFPQKSYAFPRMANGAY